MLNITQKPGSMDGRTSNVHALYTSRCAVLRLDHAKKQGVNVVNRQYNSMKWSRWRQVAVIHAQVASEAVNPPPTPGSSDASETIKPS